MNINRVLNNQAYVQHVAAQHPYAVESQPAQGRELEVEKNVVNHTESSSNPSTSHIGQNINFSV